MSDAYIIFRAGKEWQLGEVTVKRDGRLITPDRSLALRNHSPTGFEFGYGGSGPAQLALAILLDATNDESLALARYQDFKWKFIGHLDHPGGEITVEAITAFLNPGAESAEEAKTAKGRSQAKIIPA